MPRGRQLDQETRGGKGGNREAAAGVSGWSRVSTPSKKKVDDSGKSADVVAARGSAYASRSLAIRRGAALGRLTAHAPGPTPTARRRQEPPEVTEPITASTSLVPRRMERDFSACMPLVRSRASEDAEGKGSRRSLTSKRVKGKTERPEAEPRRATGQLRGAKPLRGHGPTRDIQPMQKRGQMGLRSPPSGE